MSWNFIYLKAVHCPFCDLLVYVVSIWIYKNSLHSNTTSFLCAILAICLSALLIVGFLLEIFSFYKIVSAELIEKGKFQQ